MVLCESFEGGTAVHEHVPARLLSGNLHRCPGLLPRVSFWRVIAVAVTFLQARLAHPAPRCFALQLAWQRPRVAPEDIRDTLAAVQEVNSSRCSDIILYRDSSYCCHGAQLYLLQVLFCCK